jgi:2-iminobutanoate/2-iminopropanoate deaminase
VAVREIVTDGAPAAIGPYSQGVRAGGVLYVSGQIPLTPTGDLVEGDPAAATRRALDNVRAIVETGGLALRDVVRVTLYLRDMADYSVVNEAYASYFGDPAPARVCVAVAALPRGACIEIDAVAVSDEAGGTS